MFYLDLLERVREFDKEQTVYRIQRYSLAYSKIKSFYFCIEHHITSLHPRRKNFSWKIVEMTKNAEQDTALLQIDLFN